MTTTAVINYPDNPRMVYREDVIDGICASLNGEYPQKHAVHVRPVGDRFQLTSGHHRRRAAEKHGLASIWAWVEDMDDEAAFMELATSNNQGELSPLEIGIHALKAVPLEKGGRGKKGGLSAYAERLGKSDRYIGQMRQAAEVIREVNSEVDFTVFLDKAQHLCEIHKLPAVCWPGACETVVSASMSSEDTAQAVKRSLAFAESNPVAGRWRAKWLEPAACMVAVFRGTDLVTNVRSSPP